MGSRVERSIVSCNSRSNKGTKHAKRAREDLRDKLNAKSASHMAATSLGTPRVPLEFVEKIEHLEARVKFLSER